MKTFEEKLVNEATDIFNNFDGVYKRNDDNSISVAHFGSQEFKDLMNNEQDAKDVMKFAYTDGYVEGSKNHYGNGAIVTGIVDTCLGVLIGYCFSDFISDGVDKIQDAIDKRQETKEIKRKIEEKFAIKIKRIKIAKQHAYIKYKSSSGMIKEDIFNLNEIEDEPNK